MKKILLLLFGFTIAGMLNAQKPITFTDDAQTFGSVNFPGVWVSIPETSLETVQKNWAKAIQKGTKSKPVIAGQTVSLFGAIIPEIYPDPINIESTLRSQDSVVMLFTGVELKRGELATPGSVEYDKLKSYLKSFAKSQYIDVVKEQISREEKELKAVEKELANSRKANQKLEKKVQSPQAQKDAKKELKKAQKTKKSILKKVASSENKISKSSTSIMDANSSMNANRRIQEDIGVQVNAQKMRVSEIKRKLSAIESY